MHPAALYQLTLTVSEAAFDSFILSRRAGVVGKGALLAYDTTARSAVCFKTVAALIQPRPLQVDSCTRHDRGYAFSRASHVIRKKSSKHVVQD